MDYKPQPAFKGDSYGYKKKRCMWFNSAFMDDITFANGKIIDMTFNVPPFQIYNPNNLKVISYIRDDANTKPIVIKMKEPYLTNRSVINTDKEAFPLIYCNHTGVEGMTSMSPKYLLIPQQISRFVFKIDESLNNRDGLTVNETIIQSTTTVSIKSSEYSINYEPFKHIKSGTYTATFSQGNINFNGINDTSYPLIKDGSGITINPIVWYKFDGSSTFLDSAINSADNLWNSNATFDSTNLKKGDGSIRFSTTALQFARIPKNFNWNSINTTNGISVSLWIKMNTDSDKIYTRIFDFGETFDDGINAKKEFSLMSYTNTNNLWFIISRRTSSSGAFTTDEYITSGFNCFDGTWRYITWTISTAGVWTIYINGSQVFTGTKVVIQPTDDNNYANNNLARSIWTNETQKLSGNIDDFRIYNVVLTSTQVSELYNGRLAIYNAPTFELGIELEDTNLTKDNIASIYR